MLGIFAAETDPVSVLSSGNYLLLLAFIIVILGGVIVYLARKLDNQARDSAGEIKSLNQIIYADNKEHANDYKEMAKNDQQVLSGNSQNMALLSEKIEVVKGRRA
ncbi:MAG: hypothetical protein V4563_18100 [Pseudomonadota bacterium]